MPSYLVSTRSHNVEFVVYYLCKVMNEEKVVFNQTFEDLKDKFKQKMKLYKKKLISYKLQN